MHTVRPLLLPLALALAAGCPGGVERGTVVVSLDGGRPPLGDDLDLLLDGTVTAVEADASGARSVTVDDGAGEVHTVGLSVGDAADADIAPALDVAVGDAVHLVYRYRFVWGDVAGFALSDADGLVVAAEEGAWGGALQEGDVPGLSVRRGDDVVAREAAECQPLEGFSLVFEGDEAVELVPVDTAPLSVDGAALTAIAVASWDYGESATCQISDVTGYDSWVVHR